MASLLVRDPVGDHLLTPHNSALIVIDYQPSQFAGVRSMDRDLLLENIVSTVKTERHVVEYSEPREEVERLPDHDGGSAEADFLAGDRIGDANAAEREGRNSADDLQQGALATS